MLLVLVFNPKKCRDFCHYVTFLDDYVIIFSVSGSVLEIYLNPKQVTDVSLVLKDKITD